MTEKWEVFGDHRIREHEVDKRLIDNVDERLAKLNLNGEAQQTAIDEAIARIHSARMQRIGQHLASLRDHLEKQGAVLSSIRFALWVLVAFVAVLLWNTKKF